MIFYMMDIKLVYSHTITKNTSHFGCSDFQIEKD